ncbi:MAG: TldD/PmbA family protein [Actinomycetota bacterium]|nr:TldD/PmbA family protein [Acidimicrobiia bacterium]MDQ3293229.1 TldD/PmbA family protein [Actinomycetota bacterium]
MAELLDIADRVCSWARDGEQIEVMVGRSRDIEIRVYDGEIEKLSSAESAGVGVRVIRDQRQGFAYAGTLDVDVLEEVLADARDNAGFGDPDEAYGLAEPDGVPYAELDVYREELAAFPTERKIELAMELERAVRAADPRISGLEASDYEDGQAEVAIVTTAGLRITSRETYASIVASALADDAGETQIGWWYSIGREPGELDVAACAEETARRATRLLGAGKPASKRCTVVLDPYVTSQFLGIVGYALSAEEVLKSRSLFADRLGDLVASPLVTLVDDPRDARALTATAIDGEGLATRRTELLAGGVLQAFLHNTYTARRMGTSSTGSAVRSFSTTPKVGPRALAIAPGTTSPAELFAGVDDGFYVQEVSGLHSGVNPISGDFSTGADGLRITGGALGEPVREFTIASTLQRMLLDVRGVGNDLTWLPGNAAGVTLVVGDVTVSGT